MPIVLSTQGLAERESLEAVVSTMEISCGRVDVALERTGAPVRAHLEFWPLGAGVHTFSFHGTGMRMAQTARHLRYGTPEQLSFAVQDIAPGVTRGFGDERALGHGDLMMTDLTGEYEYHRPAEGGTRSVGFDLDTLGVTVGQIRLAGRTFAANPLLGLARQHFTYVLENAEALSMSAGAAAAGAAAVDLARAFVLAAQEGAARREAMHETLLSRITAYLRAHLTDADLSPARVAAHHNISVRHLHALWSAGTGSTLEQWIMMERLTGARAQLAAGRPITALAHEWGFADASHFSRRFRQAFGVAPRDWRAEP
ncbi:helix-turn-helix transcriptional regulator [Catenuloplanes atrovinosus]|uniref:AraC-like DNA-binding protein n=1 Tax=Catenuloplanes atrovinosus TaxID=137266 RepID=A0AAE3YMK4_9ACTN|nr:helix-turn-helix transcriptional regulator [Catenuloplanes atrovinosus]MDR7275245.1 AraC-like DNA-binding protein [Catenuloplanes atrovinosus]